MRQPSNLGLRISVITTIFCRVHDDARCFASRLKAELQ